MAKRKSAQQKSVRRKLKPAKAGNKSGAAHSVARRTEVQHRELICEIGRRIWMKGFCAGNEGNHSVRLGPDRILCTPSMVSKGSLTPDDLCVVDLEGRQVSGSRKRTSEVLLHLVIYREREDVNAVVHNHPPHATAFAIAGVDLPTNVHPEAEVFLGRVPTAPYVTPGDHRLGDSIKPFIAKSNTILLGSHGVVCYGADLQEAYYRLEIVDAYARILLLVQQLGSIKQLGLTEMQELIALKNRFGFTDPRSIEELGEASGEFFERVNRSRR